MLSVSRLEILLGGFMLAHSAVIVVGKLVIKEKEHILLYLTISFSREDLHPFLA